MHELATEIMITANTLPNKENFSLIYQLSKLSISIPSNIAVSCGRNTTKDTLQFLYIARGSLYELETQVILSFDVNYIEEEKLNEILNSIIDCKNY